MSFLTIIQDAARRLSLEAPSAVVSATDPLVQQLRGLANQEGRDLVRAHNWRVLMKEKTFTTTATETQTGVLPADFDRFINETVFNRTNTRRVIGPLTAQEWQSEKAILASVLRDAFRIRGTDFIVTPLPAAGETWAFEYISDLWVDTDADGTADATAFAADANTTVFPDELLILGIIWRFRQAKGLDYAEEHRNYMMALGDAVARDGGRRSIAMGEGFPDGARIPYVSEGTWNV